MPITVALLVVLGFLILSYRQTIKAYPSAGGAYIVTRDNFGLLPAQVAGVALLTDYVLTVVRLGRRGHRGAVARPCPSLAPYTLWLSIVCVLLIAGGNLKGVRESGQDLRRPHLLLHRQHGGAAGRRAWPRWRSGTCRSTPRASRGSSPLGSPSVGLFYGASLFVVLHAFASGGAAVTGVEAISNGVPAFREPAWKNARTTLVIMGSLLGVMFLGLSVLAAKIHAAPYEAGTPTVISQIGELVYGDVARRACALLPAPGRARC